MWLASHVHDEARHVEVFTKRALAGGQRTHALAATELSLQTLLDERDFSAAALLLNVLGEGTFLDLLSFVAHHAPDAATATAARLAHQDERRHVQFGIAHIRHRLAHDPDERQRLVAAVEERAAKLVEPRRPQSRRRRVTGVDGCTLGATGRHRRRRPIRPRPSRPHEPQPDPPPARRRVRPRHGADALRVAHAEPHVRVISSNASFDVTERRRSRTYPAWGYQTSPVLKTPSFGLTTPSARSCAPVCAPAVSKDARDQRCGPVCSMDVSGSSR